MGSILITLFLKKEFKNNIKKYNHKFNSSSFYFLKREDTKNVNNILKV